MTKLTTQKILEIHEHAIERYGGLKGILNIGTIDFLVYQLDNSDNVFERAALALEKIITCHPFMDGHKRTGFQVADLMLREEGYHIHTSEKESVDALLKIARYECTVEKIERWIKRKSLKDKIRGTQLELEQS